MFYLNWCAGLCRQPLDIQKPCHPIEEHPDGYILYHSLNYYNYIPTRLSVDRRTFQCASDLRRPRLLLTRPPYPTHNASAYIGTIPTATYPPYKISARVHTYTKYLPGHNTARIRTSSWRFMARIRKNAYYNYIIIIYNNNVRATPRNVLGDGMAVTTVFRKITAPSRSDRNAQLQRKGVYHIRVQYQYCILI